MNRLVRKTIVFLLSFMLVVTYTFGGGAFAFAGTYSDSDSDKAAVEQDLQEGAEPEAQDEVADPARDSQQGEEVADETAPVEETEEAVEEPAEQIEEVAFEESATVDGVEIKVTADKGVFPEGATLKVEKLSAREEAAAEKAIDKIADEADVAGRYNFDISVLDKDGNEIQPDTAKGSVNVEFKTDEVADDSLKAEVFHIADNGEAEALEVETKGEVAKVETEGFSIYSLVFTHVDTGSQAVYNTTLAVGQEEQLWTILEAVGINPQTHGPIASATSDNSDILYVRHSPGGIWYVEARRMDSNQHRLTVVFADEAQEQIVITAHRHNFIVTGGGTSEATVKCDEDLCAYNKNAFTASISANDATYDGNGHGASRTLSSGFPTGDVQVSDIYYSKVGQLGESTTAPVNAGTYNAYFYVTPQGGNAYRVTTSFEIKKAAINVTAPEGLTLTYNGENQILHTAGSANTGTMLYADGVTTDKTAFSTNRVTKENAGTYTVSYYVKGNENYEDSPIKTITATIQKKELTVSGITAKNKVYDGTDVAELVTGNAIFAGKVDRDNLTVATTTGKFEDKNVDNGKTVTFTVTLDGEKAGNYYLTNATQTTTEADITPKALTINWYDGGNVAYTGETVRPRAVLERSTELTPDDGLAYTTDDVAVTIEQIAGPDPDSIQVGTGYKVKVTGLTGDAAGNYSIDSGNVTEEYNIVENAVTINWKDKVDGAVTVQYTGENQAPEIESLNGIKGPDVAHVHARLVEADKDGKKDVGAYELHAELYADKGYESKLADYALDSSSSIRFVITKAPLTITASGWITFGQLYTDEDAHVSFTCDEFLGEDTVENSLDLSNMKYTSNVHQRFAHITDATHQYTIEVERITAHNYDITFADGELIIYPMPVELEWYDNDGKRVVDGDNRYTYDGETHSLTAKVAGTNDNNEFVYPDGTGTHKEPVVVEEYAGATARTDANLKAEGDEHWDNPYVVKATALSNDNYTLIADPHADPETKVVTAHQDWYIDPRPVDLAWDPASMVYNAKDQWDSEKATITNKVGEDDVTLVYNEQVAKNVGEYTKSVTVLAGEGKDNYTLFQDNILLKGDFVPTYQYTWSITKAPLTIKGKGWITYGEQAKGRSDVSDVKNGDKEKGIDFMYITSEHRTGDPEKLLGDDTAAEQIEFTDLSYESTYEVGDSVTQEGTAYTVTPAGLRSANYEITYDADTLTVYPKPIRLNWFGEDGSTVSPGEAFQYIYDGEYHHLVAKADPEDLVFRDEVSVNSYEGNEEKDTCDKNEVDKYTSKATEISNANYTLLTDPKKYKDGKVDPAGEAGTATTPTDSQDWKIVPRKVAVEEWKYNTDENAPLYNGEEQVNVVTKWNLVENDEDTLVYEDNTGKDAGDYTAKIVGVEDKNYTIAGVATDALKQEWTIKPLPVELKWKWGETVYNGAEQNNTATIANLCTGDEATLTYENQSGKDAGSYETTVTAVSNDNYTVTDGKNLTGSWKIKQAPLTVTAKANTITYGQEPGNKGVTYSGFQGKDDKSVLEGTLAYSYNYAKWGKPGTYKITPSGLSGKNYKITFKTGKLTVKDKVTKIVAKAIAKGKNKGVISWNKVSGAKSYTVYQCKCNTKSKKYSLKKVATVTGTKYTTKKLSANTFYRFKVVANTDNGKVNSIVAHMTTGNVNGKFTNVKTLKVNKTSVSLKQGKTFKIKSSVTKAKKGKKLNKHAKQYRYMSDNTKVAKVNASGTITAVGKGWCRVYVQSVNGIWKTIQVTVK